jgi:uncharacterized protein (TIGR00251 family)
VLTETSHGVRLDVEVKLRASKSRVLGIKGERLSVALAAAPVDGAANQELIETLAEHFGVPRRQVRILAGAKSRRKVVELDGLGADEVRARLGAPRV